MPLHILITLCVALKIKSNSLACTPGSHKLRLWLPLQLPHPPKAHFPVATHWPSFCGMFTSPGTGPLPSSPPQSWFLLLRVTARSSLCRFRLRLFHLKEFSLFTFCNFIVFLTLITTCNALFLISFLVVVRPFHGFSLVMAVSSWHRLRAREILN